MIAEFERFLSSMSCRTIGIVYSFAPAKRPTEIWYDRWQTEVLSFYGQAVQGLGAEPYFIDVNSFCERAVTGRLPELDFVVNLNAGVRPISNWALVPAVASWCDLPILPCEADVIIAGERKDLSNLLAERWGLRIPVTYTSQLLSKLPDAKRLLAKPRDLGGSEGIHLVESSDLKPRHDYLYQEMISGYDVTLPLLYDPLLNALAPLPPIAYRPSTDDPSWFHSRETKLGGEGYQKVVVDLPADWRASLTTFASAFGIKTYCRLDLRVAATTWEGAFGESSTADLYFIEINPMPTLRKNINFLSSLEHRERFTTSQSQTLAAVEVRCRSARDPQFVRGAWILACAMYAKAKCSV